MRRSTNIEKLCSRDSAVGRVPASCNQKMSIYEDMEIRSIIQGSNVHLVPSLALPWEANYLALTSPYFASSQTTSASLLPAPPFPQTWVIWSIYLTQALYTGRAEARHVVSSVK